MSDDLTNAPGLGAEALASRAARRAERLREDPAMGRAGDAAVDEQLRQAVRRQRNYSQGAEGERLVAQTLGFLERYGWVAVHDVHWPGRPQANIDHIAVGPGGIVVIDAKNWTGDVGLKDGVLRQNGYSRVRETTAVTEATSAVASRLAPQHRTAATGVLCLVGHDVDPVRVDQTTVLGRSALAEHLVALPARLTAYDVADVARMLSRDLAGDRSPAVLTSQELDARRPAPRGPRREHRRPPTGGRPPRRGAGRALRRGLAKIALILVIIALAPRILLGIAESVGTGLTSVVTPTRTPTTPVPAPLPVTPEVPTMPVT